MIVHGFGNAAESTSLHTAIKKIFSWNLVKCLPKTHWISRFREVILIENNKAVIFDLFLFRNLSTWMKMFDEFFDALVISTWNQFIYIQLRASFWTFQPSRLTWRFKSCGRRGWIMGKLGQMRFKNLLTILKVTPLTLMIFPSSLAINSRTLLVIDIISFSMQWRFEIVNRYLSLWAQLKAKLSIIKLLSLGKLPFVLQLGQSTLLWYARIIVWQILGHISLLSGNFWILKEELFIEKL